MNEQALKELVGQWRESILEDNGKNADRMLLALVREVERETRHQCMNLAYSLAEQINALKDA